MIPLSGFTPDATPLRWRVASATGGARISAICLQHVVHNTVVDALCRFLKDCGMDDVQAEVKYWDPARIGTDGSWRVPDVTCTNPRTGVYCLMSIHSLSRDLCDACGINLQLGNISRVQTRLGSKTETKSSEIFVEDY